MEYFVPNVPVIPMDPSRAMGDYFTLWSTGCLFCKQNGRGMQHVLTLSSKHYSLFTPEITWHPKKIAARLISLVLPGMCYASFRENIHYLNSNSGYCEHYWRSQRTRFRKKKLLECMDTYSFLKWRNNKIKEFSEHRSFLSHVNHQDQKPWFPHSCFL